MSERGAEVKEKTVLVGQRHVQIFLLFTSLVVNYIGKYNASVAVVAMTNAATTNPNFPEYKWSSIERSYILSSFAWGDILTQFLGGYLCRGLGVKRTMFISTCGASIFGLLPPICVGWGGWGIYCGIRIVQGLFHGLLFPSIHTHLAAWCPVNERNRLGAFTNTGIECGNLLAMFMCGNIDASSIGWPGSFYVSGGMGLFWCIAWLLFAANNPIESKFITNDELNQIETSKYADKTDLDAIEMPSTTTTAIPWRAIFTSMPFWAAVVARSANEWGSSTLQAEIPSYMRGVLELNMKKNALFSALPYLAKLCMAFVYIIAADVLFKRKILSLTAIRKTFNSLAFWVPAMGLVAIGFLADNQKTLAIVLLITSLAFNGGTTIGSGLNTIDLSPNYAGLLMGIANSFANALPILTPLLVGVVVTNENDRAQWQIVFIVAAVIFALGNLFYLIFGKTEKQPWDSPDYLARKKTKLSSIESTETCDDIR